MLKLVSDVNVDGRIVSGLLRREPTLDLVLSQDVLGEKALDPEILAWAATQQRVVLSNDRSTMIDDAYDRVAAGLPMMGLIAATDRQSIGDAIEDILIILVCASLEDFQNEAVMYLPY